MKQYIKPDIVVYSFEPTQIMENSGKSNWTINENGEHVNPGGNIPPGQNKQHSPEYRNNLWDN